MQYANHLQPFSKAGKFWQRVLTAPGSLNIEPPPKIPSILPTLRPLFRPFFLGAERLLYVLYFLFSKWTVAMHETYERPRTLSKM